MSERRYEAEEVAALGEAIYEREIRSEVEPEHDGKYLVIDVGTGEYSISEGELAAFEGAERKNPGGRFYVKRVGRGAVHRIGAARYSGGHPG